MIRLLFIVGLIFVIPISYANPAPFGLEIGTTTIKDLKAKYKTKSKSESLRPQSQLRSGSNT